MRNKLRTFLWLAAVASSAWLGYEHGSRRDDVLVREIANSYFRAGQQAALIARNHARNDKWPEGMMIDDPRIWEVVRFLNDGSVLGLDTNSWAGFYDATNRKDPHIWTVLK